MNMEFAQRPPYSVNTPCGGRCVVLRDVIYRKECQEKKIPPHEQVGVRALTFGHTFAVLCAPAERGLTHEVRTWFPENLALRGVRVLCIYLSSLWATANSSIHGRGLTMRVAPTQ